MPFNRLFILFSMSIMALHAIPFASDVTPKSIEIITLPARMKQGQSYILEAQVTFDDNSTAFVDANISSSDPSIVHIEDNLTLTALKEGVVTLSVSYGQLETQAQALVFLEIHGYTLPPEPDPKVNNATLLGVDSNDNGVRDDVERMLLQRYEVEHPVVTEVAMQASRAWLIVLTDPYNALEADKFVDAAHNCEVHYSLYSVPKLINKYERITSGVVFKAMINTEARKNAEEIYENILSGHVFSSAFPHYKKYCDFNLMGDDQ